MAANVIDELGRAVKKQHFDELQVHARVPSCAATLADFRSRSVTQAEADRGTGDKQVTLMIDGLTLQQSFKKVGIGAVYANIGEGEVALFCYVLILKK